MVKIKRPDNLRQKIAIAAFALAALMALDVLYQIGMHIRWRSWLPDTLEAATSRPSTTRPTTTSQSANSQQAGSQPTSGKAVSERGKPPAKPPVILAAIRKRNILTAPVQKGHGMQLTGVLGNTALFNAREGGTVGIEEGKSGSGIKVISIDGYSVTIEHEGKTETMKLFPDEGASRPSPATSSSTRPSGETGESTRTAGSRPGREVSRPSRPARGQGAQP